MTVVAVASMLAFVSGAFDAAPEPEVQAPELLYTMEGDGEVTWSPATSIIVLKPAKGGKVLSFTVNGVEHKDDLNPSGTGFWYASDELLDSDIHVKFSHVGGTSAKTQSLLLLFLILGAGAAAALFLVRKKRNGSPSR